MRRIHCLPVLAYCVLLLTPMAVVHAGDRLSYCGGAGQRACCFDEAFPSCDGDNVETSTYGGQCGGPITGFFGASAGSCVLNPNNPNNRSDCGGAGQRACCIGEASPSCDTGLLEANPIGGTGQSCPGTSLPAGICFAPTPCGAPGQRACCTLEKGPATPACNANAAPLPGGVGKQQFCGDAASAFVGLVPGSTCVAVTACGGEGQRACCAVPSEIAALGKTICASGTAENLGVTGDATCTDNIAITSAAIGTCVASNPTVPTNESGTVEPTTNWSPSTTAPLPSGSLRGFADLHLHVLSHLAHGKEILAGYPAPVDAQGNIVATAAPSASVALSPADDFAKHGLALHAPGGDTVGFGTNDSTLSHNGWPYFNGWPSWNSTTHQQVYYKWLERAWRGGMRLITMLAVTNEALCKSNNTYGTAAYAACGTSMTSILEQLQAARDFEAFIDNQSGGPGQGWFRIVTSPQEARQVIRSGKLAVVLGIEVDNLFGCKESGCPKVTRKGPDGNVILDANNNPVLYDMNIQEEVDKIYALGVRHVFPIHNFDNNFGAAATWQDTIGVGQAVSEGRFWKVQNCRPQGYGFSIDTVWSGLQALLGFNSAEFREGDGATNAGYGNATCNQFGLYSTRSQNDPRLGDGGKGPDLLNALMNRGMLIDIDHMSNKSLEETFVIARQRWAEYPLLASHVQFFDRHQQDFQDDPSVTGGNAGRHERMRTAAQLQAIRAGGGMVAAMLKDDVQDTGPAGKQVTVAYTPQYGSPIPNNCVHSSKSFAQSYQYAVDLMNGPVAFGSDFNGIAAHIGPRFGSEACARTFRSTEQAAIDERLAQESENNRVPYPFEMPGFGTLSRQRTGFKTFDYNTDGMAHVGLLPDFVKDLQQIGMAPQYIDAIFCSAERYIQVWERAVAISNPNGTPDDLPNYSQMTCNNTAPADTTPPTSSASISPAPTVFGWNNGTATVTITAQDEPNGSGLEMISYLASGASSFADSPPASPASFPVSNQGTTSISYFSTDVAGNREASKSLAVRIDTTVPVITGSRTPAANADGWNKAGVTASFLCSDALSGIATCSLPQSFITEGTNLSATGTATDRAGNTASTAVSGINVDLTAPTITADVTTTPGDGPNSGWYKGIVTIAYTCSDALSGIAPGGCPATQTLASDGLAQSTSGTVSDRAGNAATATVNGINIDRTPPTITGSRDPAANDNGWNNVDVTASYVCQDVLSGIVSCTLPQVVSGEGAAQSSTGSAMDLAGNLATATVSPISIDKTPPTISASAAPAPNPAGWNRTDVTVTFTCADALSGVDSCAAPVTLGTEGSNLSASGTAVDLADNTAVATLTGIKLDKTAPVVEVNGVSNGATYKFGAVPVAGCSTTDALSGVAAQATVSVTGGTSNGVGTFTATCSGAADVAGNTASESVTYQVHYDFTGFFNPVSNLPVINGVTAGQAIPIKFSLAGDFGLDILAAGSPASVGMICLTGGIEDNVEETVNAGSSSLTYSGGQYTYVWKTAKPWSGSCRAFLLKLDDGTTHQANFKFK